MENEKLAIIKLESNYGGVKAWLIQESYNGIIADPNGFKVLKREYFEELQNVITEYLENGYKVEVLKN
tara:strand:- start:241 stop:444 length:204 start_codon:yes stop_codon:yes gene_type:complete